MILIKSISDDSTLWRVDGIGAVKIYDRSVPRMKVALSEIKQDGIHSSLTYGQTTGKQKTINEPLNRISDLLVGSCWQRGIRINKLTPFEGVRYTVDTSKIQFFRPGDSLTLGGKKYPNALPAGAIKFGKSCRYLNCSLYAVVPVLNNSQTEYLIVPCSELFRFYVGVSNRFSNSAIRNPLEDYVEWKDPVLRIKHRLSRMEQFVAYRAFCSQVGKEWFQLPSNYLRSIAIRNGSLGEDQRLPLVLKATFPFKDTTTLTISGKRFLYRNEEGEECWAVFAANLIKCSYIEYFDPIIESDVYSAGPEPGLAGADPDDMFSDNDFDDEEIEESEEPPNGQVRPMVLLNSSNRFDAMNGLNFVHVHPSDLDDPVYHNDSGQPLGAFSHEEVENTSENNGVGESTEFESQVESIDRQLSDFIKMIILLRSLAEGLGWSIVTRSSRSTLEIEGEVVTTFLDTNNKRRTWHLIEDSSGKKRYRQIAWVEIDLGEGNFVYLVEMELKSSETARSTLLIFPKEGKYMPEQDFEVFLNMTAVKNRWPKSTHSWSSAKALRRANAYFNLYHHVPLTHPSFHSNDDHVQTKYWAEGTYKNIKNKLGVTDVIGGSVI